MGAGSSTSPRVQPTRRSSAGSAGSPQERRRRRVRRSRDSLDAPPQAAVLAAQTRGDVTHCDNSTGQRVTLCLCKPRRLEFIIDGAWTRAVESLGVSISPDAVHLLSDDDTLAELPQREAALLRVLGSLARLATRASVPHDLWKDIREAGIEVSQTTSETCFYCGRQLATAPAFCQATGRLHPVPPFQGWEPCPPNEAIRAAEERGDAVRFNTETGTVQKFVFVNTGRLEKLVDNEWKRPVVRLEVPHIGARTLRDYHITTPSGCMLPGDMESIKHTLTAVAIIADRAGVEHNLWEHCNPAPQCKDCHRPLHLDPVCSVTNRQHMVPPTTPSLPSLGPLQDNALRVRRRLSGPSENPHTPQVMPLSPDPPEHMSQMEGVPSMQLPGASSEPPSEKGGEEEVEKDTVDHVVGTVSDECCVCLEEPKNTVLMPCRHLCVCGGCAQILTQCPLCRFAVVHRFEVF